jgi:hypothetical protein
VYLVLTSGFGFYRNDRAISKFTITAYDKFPITIHTLYHISINTPSFTQIEIRLYSSQFVDTIGIRFKTIDRSFRLNGLIKSNNRSIQILQITKTLKSLKNPKSKNPSKPIEIFDSNNRNWTIIRKPESKSKLQTNIRPLNRELGFSRWLRKEITNWEED